MKNINTLIPDIQELLKTKGWFTESISTEFVTEMTSRLSGQFNREASRPTLRLSQMGDRCPCELWHMINKPELAEELPAWAEMKFSFGHTIEGLAIALAKAAGHTVEGEQDEVCLDGVVGHRDCLIDGCLVDVKSSSSKGMAKYRDGSIREDDPFGYLAQLDGYLLASASDDRLKVKDKGYLLVIDKQLGHMVLYEHKLRNGGEDIRRRISTYKNIVRLQTPPRCTCGSVKHGESGNLKLDVKASYNQFKFCCKPNLRVFNYKDRDGFKPVFLSTVKREPDVPEITHLYKRHGRNDVSIQSTSGL